MTGRAPGEAVTRSDRVMHAVLPLNALATALQRHTDGGAPPDALEAALALFQTWTGVSDGDLAMLRAAADRCLGPSSEEHRAQARTALWTLIEGYRDSLIETWSPATAPPLRW